MTTSKIQTRQSNNEEDCFRKFVRERLSNLNDIDEVNQIMFDVHNDMWFGNINTKHLVEANTKESDVQLSKRILKKLADSKEFDALEIDWVKEKLSSPIPFKNKFFYRDELIIECLQHLEPSNCNNCYNCNTGQNCKNKVQKFAIKPTRGEKEQPNKCGIDIIMEVLDEMDIGMSMSYVSIRRIYSKRITKQKAISMAEDQLNEDMGKLQS